MALINCPECGKEISDKSEVCIHCGYPLQKMKNTCPDCGRQFVEDAAFCVCGYQIPGRIPPDDAAEGEDRNTIVAPLASENPEEVSPKVALHDDPMEDRQKLIAKYSARNQSSLKIPVIIIVVSFVVLFVFLLKSCPFSSSYNTAEDAKVCAQDAVSQKLISPSTAKFCPAYAMIATNLGGDKWTVSGYVDAQNAFGGTVRKHWTVTLTVTESGYKGAVVTFSD